MITRARSICDYCKKYKMCYFHESKWICNECQANGEEKTHEEILTAIKKWVDWFEDGYKHSDNVIDVYSKIVLLATKGIKKVKEEKEKV